MAKEIERKFLVTSDAFKTGTPPLFIRQGFISKGKDSIVRVRIQGTRGFLALKGGGTSISRTEFEYEVPVEDAYQMLEKLCAGPIIEKFRHIIEFEGYTWEVDEFIKENSGLIIAEIELETEDEQFPKPLWVGAEVTGDSRYYNASLIDHPYSKW